MTNAVLFDLMGTLLVEDTRGPGDPFGNFRRVLSTTGVSLEPDELRLLLARQIPCARAIRSAPRQGPISSFLAWTRWPSPLKNYFYS